MRNIDKSMIGFPTNFQHCTHIGCSDVAMNTNTLPISDLSSREPKINVNGYHQQPLVAHLKLIDLKSA